MHFCADELNALLSIVPLVTQSISMGAFVVMAFGRDILVRVRGWV